MGNYFIKRDYSASDQYTVLSGAPYKHTGHTLSEDPSQGDNPALKLAQLFFSDLVLQGRTLSSRKGSPPGQGCIFPRKGHVSLIYTKAQCGLFVAMMAISL